MTEVPPILYKYRSMRGEAAEFTRQIVVDHQLYFPRISSFNDPFDSVPQISMPKTRIGLERALTRAMRESPAAPNRRDGKRMAAHLMRQPSIDLQAELQAGIRTTNDDVGVFCVSARPDQVLMWSLYASCHTGLAVGFKRDRGSPFHFAQRVRYSANRPALPSFSRKDKSDVVRQAMTTKADFWAYEEEWRLFNLPSLKPGLVAIEKDVVVEIILGPMMSDPDVQTIKAWNAARLHPARLKRATIDPYQFRLHIEDEL